LLDVPVLPRGGMLSPEWLAESVRLTLFSHSHRPLMPIWQTLIDGTPEETSERTADLFRSEIGIFGAGHLFVIQQGGTRLDLIYGVKAEATLIPGINQQKDLLHVGPITAAVEAFLTILYRIDHLLLNLNRVAFAPALVRQFESHHEAAVSVERSAGLPLRDGDQDILWQVNRPVAGRSFDGRINVVEKWQSSSTQTFTFSPVVGAQIIPPIREVHLAKLDFDVNTITKSLGAFDDSEPVLREVINETFRALASYG
jgi:hypothetical protein